MSDSLRLLSITAETLPTFRADAAVRFTGM
jgi:hypothetical protein